MKKIKNINLVILLFSVLFLAIKAGPAYAASSASLSLSGSNFNIAETFSVTIYENSGTDPVNVVETDLAYDPAQLEFVGLDDSDSAFPGSLVGSGGNGSIKITRYASSAATGSAKVATVNFKAPAAAGSSAVNFAPSSHVISNGQDIWDKKTDGTTYSFTDPKANQAPAPVSPTTSKPVTPVTTVKNKTPQTTKQNHRTVSFGSTQDTTTNQAWMIYAWAGLSALIACGLTLFHYHKNWIKHQLLVVKHRIRRLTRPSVTST